MNDIVRDGLCVCVCGCVCSVYVYACVCVTQESLSIPSRRPGVGRCCLSCAKGSHSSLSHPLFCQEHPVWVLGGGGQLTMNMKPRKLVVFQNVYKHGNPGHIGYP